MSGFQEYGEYDALGLAELVQKREVKPEELLEEAQKRVDAVNPRLNAVVRPMFDEARQTLAAGVPEGPFAGVPFLLKDLITTYAGVPFTSGSRFFKDYIPKQDSELLKRIKAAGLVVCGKTNTPELGLMPVTEPELFGPAHNPWNLERTPGGSSGGSAISVAARIVPMASGGDGGGSLRIPASCCGVMGMKPTRGRNPTGPEAGDLWYGAIAEGVISRSVRDNAAMLDITGGADPGAPHFPPPPARPFLDEVGADPGKLRIAYSAEPILGKDMHPECKRGLEETVKLLTELGHEVEEAEPPLDGQLFAD
jgi:amidase